MPTRSRTVGAMSMQCENWLRGSRVRGDPRRPGHHHRVAGAAEMAGHLLAPLERGVVGVRPRRGEMRSGVFAAERLDAAVLLDERQLLIGIEHHPVEEGHLVERSGDGALHRRTVVAPDVEDQGVVQVRRGRRPRRAAGRRSSRRSRRTRRRPPSGAHTACAASSVRLSQAGKRSGRSVSSVSGGTMPSVLLALQSLLPVDIPAVVELPAVLVGPLGEHVVRGMGRAGRVVHHPRLRRVLGPHIMQPARPPCRSGRRGSSTACRRDPRWARRSRRCPA